MKLALVAIAMCAGSTAVNAQVNVTNQTNTQQVDPTLLRQQQEAEAEAARQAAELQKQKVQEANQQVKEQQRALDQQRKDVRQAEQAQKEAEKVQREQQKAVEEQQKAQEKAQKEAEKAQKEQQKAIEEQKKAQLHLEEEFGDSLHCLINYGRWLGIDPSVALRKTMNKFESRFHYIEEKMKEQGIPFDRAHHRDMMEFWTAAKKIW